MEAKEQNDARWQKVFGNIPYKQRISKFESDETNGVAPSTKANSEEEYTSWPYEYKNTNGQPSFQGSTKPVTRIDNSMQYPWSCIGLLTFTIGQEKRSGTATLIGHNVIITSAFNCFDLTQHKQVTNIVFTPACYKGRGKEQFKAKNIHYPVQFQSINSKYEKSDAQIKKYGYAMIQLDCQTNLQETYGSLGYAFFSIQEEDVTLAVTGYGSNQEKQLSLQSYQIKSSGQVAELSNLEKSMDGAPIIACSEGSYFIIGIYHQGCHALKLKKHMYQNLCDWFFSYNYQINKYSDSIGSEGCKWLVQKRFDNLNVLSLERNEVGNEGCEWLGRGKWPHLKKLQLKDNNIGSLGCEWIAKGDWKELHTVELDSNCFGDEGCLKLSQANWPNLHTLDLYGNYIGNKGCEGLSKANWPLLSILKLRNNCVGTEGCEWLSKANWKNLYSLNLQLNQVGAQGCKWLSQANWKELRNLILEENGIGDEGCLWLVKAKWQKLIGLVLVGNGISSNGCKSLSSGNWPNLRHLDLNSNSVTAEGCKWLRKGEWPELKLLSFWNNCIEKQEDTEQLLRSRFQNLKTLQF